jgi:hypothetical protein
MQWAVHLLCSIDTRSAKTKSPNEIIDRAFFESDCWVRLPLMLLIAPFFS